MFRSSSANIDQLSRMINAQMSANEVSESDRKQFERYINCLKAGKGKLVACEEEAAPIDHKIKSTTRSQQARFDGRLIILTDSSCFSSCELIVDEAKRRPNSLHVGLETNASTPYGDIKFDIAPSGLFFYKVPTKVFPWLTGKSIVPDIVLQYNPELENAGIDSLMVAVEDLLKSKRF
jgi:hypothetical protein